MKKFLVLLLLLVSLVTEAKIREVVVSGGFSLISTNKIVSAGANLGVQFNHLYVDYVNNFEQGIGNYEPFRTPLLYTFRNRRVSGVNFGYEFSFLGHPKIFLLPTIGYFSMKNIYQSSSAPTTHFYDFYKDKITLGLGARYYFNNRFGLGISRNGIEKFKFSVCYVFF